MKKFFTTLLAFVALSVQAQYLPNGGFDSWKGDGNAGSTYQSSNGNEMRKRPGDEPTSWFGSSINQSVKVLFNVTKQETLIFKSTGRNGSAVKLQNKWVGAAGIGSNAPAFISFATPWVYAVSTVSECDGGMYGSMPFSCRPDAIKGWFKRTGGTGEKAHIIVYLWKGTFQNNIKSAKSNDTKDDTDRAVMGRVSSSGNGVRIASCDHEFSTTTNNDWQEIVVPLNYENDYIPEKMNIIISSGDYWNRNNVKENSVLEADDVEFVYYSELASLRYKGKNYLEQGKTSYTIYDEYDESQLTVTSNGRGAVIEKKFDSSTNILTITVKGNDCVAAGSRIQSYSVEAILAHIKKAARASNNVHTYTVTFKREDPLTVVSVTPDEPVESLKTIQVEYSDVIYGTYKSSALQQIYVGSKLNKASFKVDGKVLTVTLDKEIATPGEYALYIPAGLITRESGKDVTSDGKIVFTVKAPDLEVLSVTPDKPVWWLKNITVEYSDEIAGTYSADAASKIYVGSSENTASFSVSGRKLTITLDKKLDVAGEHGLYIPAGLITRTVNGEDVVCDGEIKFTVRDASEKVTAEVVSVTPSKPVESLKTIVVEYDEDIVGTYNPLDITEIYVDSLRTTTKPLKVNRASFVVENNLLTITLKNEITAPGEYMLYIPEGLITCKSNGESVECNGEIKFTVKKIEPLEVVSVTPTEVVESLQAISIEYSDDIAGTYSAGASSKIHVGDESNTASFSVAGCVLTIVLDNPITATGEYPLYIPAGLVTREVNGEDVVCNGEIKFAVEEPAVPEVPADSYTPAYTGVKTRNGRWITNVSFTSAAFAGESSNRFEVDNSGQLCYNDYTENVTVKAIPGETVSLEINDDDETIWMHAYVYIDADNDGFTAAIADGSNWQPVGDLVSYSFYNDGVSSDEKGWNSVGAVITGDDRSTVDLPEFTVPATPGTYRMRVKLDWCNIDPAGDSDGMHGDFMENGGQIVDFMLQVVRPEVDYTPSHNGTRNYTERNINAVKFTSAQHGETRYDLTASERVSEYLDLTETLEFKAAPGEEVSVAFETEGSWVNHYIYIDYNYDGFTASIENNSDWKPAEDLVSYSFYNNGGSSDERGWNSVGLAISGDDRSYPSLPAFTVPEEPGVYRMRIKQDWCSIDPDGDNNSNFGGTFSNYGGQIIDVVLNVTDGTGVEDVEVGDGKKVIYDLQGRKLSDIVKSGIYIINGKKVLVK